MRHRRAFGHTPLRNISILRRIFETVPNISRKFYEPIRRLFASNICIHKQRMQATKMGCYSMKRKLLAALLAALLLLSGCQYSVVEDADEQQLSLGQAAAAEAVLPSPTATVAPLQNGNRD